MRQRQQAARSPGVGIRDGGTIRLSDNETGSGRNDDGKRWRGRFRFQVLRRAELVLGFWYYKEWGHLCHHGIGVRTLIVERADDRLRSREAISSLLGVETWLRHTELRGTQRSHQSLFGSFSISVLLASHQRFENHRTLRCIVDLGRMPSCPHCATDGKMPSLLGDEMKWRDPSVDCVPLT